MDLIVLKRLKSLKSNIICRSTELIQAWARSGIWAPPGPARVIIIIIVRDKPRAGHYYIRARSTKAIVSALGRKMMLLFKLF